LPWTEQEVKDEFLSPVNKALRKGMSLLEAETQVWKRLGLLQEAADA
jgi:hypothetical protein